MLPPPLQWIPSVTDSMSRALGCGAVYHLKATVNPLVYTVTFEFSETQSPKMMMRLWNIIQMYAYRNEATCEGMNHKDGKKLIVAIGMRRRFGEAKDLVP